MRIKTDEDLPASAKEFLLSRGHDCRSVLDQNLGGYKDRDLWEIVQSEKRLLITSDKGFADIRNYPPGTHFGIVLLRPDDDGVRPIIDLLQKAVDAVDFQKLSGTVTVVSPRSIRVRR